MTAYLHEDEKQRSAVVILPGGAYHYCSPGEGEPVAKRYYESGYNGFVLEYSTIDGIFGSPKKGKDEVVDCAVEDVKEAFRYLSDHTSELKIDEEKIVLAGFSAGANLALTAVLYQDIRPLCLLLGYGAYSDDSAASLGVGKLQLYEKLDENTPPAFLFMCQGDPVVSASDSLKLALACSEKKVPFELHGYVTGGHGLSLGTEASGIVNKDYATWFEHSLRFIANIQKKSSLILGDIEYDLDHIGISSRIGALMQHEKAWALIQEKMPQIVLRAVTDSVFQATPLQRVWQWGMDTGISEEEMDRLLKEL